MKKRRALLLTLLALLLVVGIPTGFLVRAYRREQASRNMMAAISEDDMPAALTALKAGADPNTRDHSWEKPLSFIDHIKQFIHGLSPHTPTPQPDGRATVLMLCMEDPWISDQLVQALLDAGANPNEGGDYYPHSLVSPLMIAAQNGMLSKARLLLAHGCNLHQKDQAGNTALHYAAEYSEPKMIGFLLDFGADINAINNDGETPLHRACYIQNIENVIFLVKHRANVNIGNHFIVANFPETPLDVAIYTFSGSDHNAIVNRLREAGAKTGQELSSQSASLPKHQ
ncbi:MAG TPA: ankyrin repeat domain-containing protein [Chthonomonadaceae bacterium]|nr:ankyrin repeat domain-containing protein [Chthonomonadaceae bacterium]